jgi:hypothetical protein
MGAERLAGERMIILPGAILDRDGHGYHVFVTEVDYGRGFVGAFRYDMRSNITNQCALNLSNRNDSYPMDYIESWTQDSGWRIR